MAKDEAELLEQNRELRVLGRDLVEASSWIDAQLRALPTSFVLDVGLRTARLEWRRRVQALRDAVRE